MVETGFNPAKFVELTLDRIDPLQVPQLREHEQKALWQGLQDRLKNHSELFDQRCEVMWAMLTVMFGTVAHLAAMTPDRRTTIWNFFSDNLAQRSNDFEARFTFDDRQSKMLVAAIVEFGTAADVVNLNPAEKSFLRTVLDHVKKSKTSWNERRHGHMLAVLDQEV